MKAENTESDDYVVYEDDSEAPDEFGQELSDFLSSSLETDEDEMENDAITKENESVSKDVEGGRSVEAEMPTVNKGVLKHDENLDESMLEALPDEVEDEEEDEDDIMAADDEEELEHELIEASDHEEIDNQSPQTEANSTISETNTVGQNSTLERLNSQDSRSNDTIEKGLLNVTTTAEKDAPDGNKGKNEVDAANPNGGNDTASALSSNEVLHAKSNETSELSNSTKARDNESDKTDSKAAAADPLPQKMDLSDSPQIDIKILAESAKNYLLKKMENSPDNSVPELSKPKSSAHSEDKNNNNVHMPALSAQEGSRQDLNDKQARTDKGRKIFSELHQQPDWRKVDPLKELASKDQEVIPRQPADKPVLTGWQEEPRRRFPLEPEEGEKWPNNQDHDYFSSFQRVRNLSLATCV